MTGADDLMHDESYNGSRTRAGVIGHFSKQMRLEERLLKMTYEEMEKTMQFILEQQAQFAANMGEVQDNIKRLTVAQRDLTVAQSELATAQSELSAAQSRTEATVDRLTRQVEHIARQQAHINEVVAVIADSQQHTDEKLNALIDIVREGRNGGTA